MPESLWGFHRLYAAQQLHWETIEATLFAIDLPEEMARLAELQENCARHDLTGAQRKQYAAEIGRLLSILERHGDILIENDEWFREFIKHAGMPQPTAYVWWKSFCQERDLSLKPSQALDIHKEQFFDWLDAQHRKAEEEKAQRAAEERRFRQARDCAEAVEYLRDLALEYGFEPVEILTSGNTARPTPGN